MSNTDGLNVRPETIIADLRQQLAEVTRQRDEERANYQRLRAAVNGSDPVDLEYIRALEKDNQRLITATDILRAQLEALKPKGGDEPCPPKTTTAGCNAAPSESKPRSAAATETPRTYAYIDNIQRYGWKYGTQSWPDFARSLERALTTMREERDETTQAYELTYKVLCERFGLKCLSIQAAGFAADAHDQLAADLAAAQAESATLRTALEIIAGNNSVDNAANASHRAAVALKASQP